MSEVLGQPWGKAYALLTPDGEQITLQGYDNGMNIVTPEASSGWDLAHVAPDPDGDPDVLVIAGQKFRRASA